MSLTLETLIISALMAAFCLVPRFFSSVKTYSHVFLLIGTGALLGIYFFDLLPEVVEVGGRSSLWIILGVWAIYSLVHSLHLHHHQKEHCELDAHPPHDDDPVVHVGLLMTSMVAHCLASGMFLALSRDLSESIEYGVFWALMTHKGYEALSVSLVLQESVPSRTKLAGLTAIYALSFPAGVALTQLALPLLGGPGKEDLLQTVAMVVASVAAGSLMGCMVHDFILPSLRQIRRRRREVAWVALGLLGTLAFTQLLLNHHH